MTAVACFLQNSGNDGDFAISIVLEDSSVNYIDIYQSD